MKHQKRTIPTCARCKRISVLSPCRGCATEKELAVYPVLPDDSRRFRTVTQNEVGNRGN